jgi:hypothetical protein
VSEAAPRRTVTPEPAAKASDNTITNGFVAVDLTRIADCGPSMKTWMSSGLALSGSAMVRVQSPANG